MMSLLSRVLLILFMGGYIVYGNVHSATEAVRLHPSTVENVTVPHGSDVTVTFSIPNITDMAYIRVFTPNPRWRNHSLYLLSDGHPHNFTTACHWLQETLHCNLTVIDVQTEDEGEYRIENDICHEHPLTNHACTPSEVRKFRISAFISSPVLQTTQSAQSEFNITLFSVEDHTGTYIGDDDTQDLGAAAGIIGGTCGFLAALWLAALCSVRGSLDRKEVEYKSVEDIVELDAMLKKELEVEDNEEERQKTRPPKAKAMKVKQNGRVERWTTV
ncbi:PREDICTED: uncharacterized protein LOC109480436 [Branchiostoma belcheri]|uniref:Uncharacterized protein LOC109480436 n=1 Tax=Branchiostoma belcheri TaxID=7741 RepID=A0A6P4ZA25_BRABE|nr:PREDICTED: uncharacterized protein LOC109480436 [Branchiostoma belcheri]